MDFSIFFTNIGHSPVTVLIQKEKLVIASMMVDFPGFSDPLECINAVVLYAEQAVDLRWTETHTLRNLYIRNTEEKESKNLEPKMYISW